MKCALISKLLLHLWLCLCFGSFTWKCKEHLFWCQWAFAIPVIFFVFFFLLWQIITMTTCVMNPLNGFDKIAFIQRKMLLYHIKNCYKLHFFCNLLTPSNKRHSNLFCQIHYEDKLWRHWDASRLFVPSITQSEFTEFLETKECFRDKKKSSVSEMTEISSNPDDEGTFRQYDYIRRQDIFAQILIPLTCLQVSLVPVQVVTKSVLDGRWTSIFKTNGANKTIVRLPV